MVPLACRPRQAHSLTMATVKAKGLQHWRPIAVVALFVIAACIVVAAILLPQWIVSQSVGNADPNSRLNAVIATRGMILGVLTPVAVAVAGIAALLNYRETAGLNRRLYELAIRERGETRPLRRVDLYEQFLTACDNCKSAAWTVHHGDPHNPGYLAKLSALSKPKTSLTSCLSG